MTAKIAEKAGKIYLRLKRENKVIDLRDIFIGANALIYNIPLATINRKHFTRIKGLKFLKII